METNNELRERIQAYKSYTQQVKDRVLAQVPNYELNERQAKEVSKRLPAVMKANREYLKKEARIIKAVQKLEVHTYAPELNKLHLKSGEVIKVSGADNIESAVKIAIRQGV